MFRVSRRSRIRKPEETLPELAQAIRRLTRQAYPDATVSLRESIAKDQFIEALADPEQKWPVRQWDCKRDTGSVSSGYRIKYHSGPVVEGHFSQSSVNTKPT